MVTFYKVLKTGGYFSLCQDLAGSTMMQTSGYLPSSIINSDQILEACG